MTAKRRGTLGGTHRRTFESGETYVVAEVTGPPDTISEYLADQFVDAGEAEEVDAATATAVESPEKALAEHTVPELREIAEGLDLDLPSSTRKDDLVKAIEAARAAASEADDQADDDE